MYPLFLSFSLFRLPLQDEPFTLFLFFPSFFPLLEHLRILRNSTNNLFWSAKTQQQNATHETNGRTIKSTNTRERGRIEWVHIADTRKRGEKNKCVLLLTLPLVFFILIFYYLLAYTFQARQSCGYG